MLVWGTANPEGLCESYNGLYLRDSDIRSAIGDIIGKPVKIEHRGGDVGRVVSAFANNGKLDILLEIDKTSVEGAIIAELVRRGTCKELSLGYSAHVTASSLGEDVVGRKKIQEVSLVRKGARDKCLIHGTDIPAVFVVEYEQPPTFFRAFLLGGAIQNSTRIRVVQYDWKRRSFHVQEVVGLSKTFVVGGYAEHVVEIKSNLVVARKY